MHVAANGSWKMHITKMVNSTSKDKAKLSKEVNMTSDSVILQEFMRDTKRKEWKTKNR